MKNMFLVINKEKVYAYVVSVCTIITLFFMSGMINSNFGETEETSSNVEVNSNSNSTNIDNSKNSVKTQNKEALNETYNELVPNTNESSLQNKKNNTN